MDSEMTCCEWANQVMECDGGLIYPDVCDCICHTQDEDD